MSGDSTYNLTLEDGNVLRIAFGQPAQNDQIVKDASAILKKLVKSGSIAGGELLKINGPASLPVAMNLAHGVAHLYKAVACFDPKMGKYIVAITHGDEYKIGEVLD